jgi:hypothetical protein
VKTSERITSPAGQRHLDALETQLAQHVAHRLQLASESLPHDIVERLRFAREQALNRARHQRQQETVPALAVSAAGHGLAVLGGPPSVWLRLASALPLLVLVAGLVLIQQHHEFEQIHVAAEIDAALLADTVPPTAYGDPGFAEFLRNADLP